MVSNGASGTPITEIAMVCVDGTGLIWVYVPASGPPEIVIVSTDTASTVKLISEPLVLLSFGGVKIGLMVPCGKPYNCKVYRPP